MNINFAGRELDCRHLELATGSIKEHDIVVVDDAKLEVVAVTRNCPRLEALNKTFTAWLLEDESGHRIHSNSIFGTLEVYRVKH